MTIHLHFQLNDEAKMDIFIADTDPAVLYSETVRMLDVIVKATLLTVKRDLAKEFLPPDAENGSH